MYIQTNHTTKNPRLFDINKICNIYIFNHNKKYDLFSFKIYFINIFIHNQTTNIYFISTSSFFSKITNNNHFLETEFYDNDLRINLGDSLHHYIDQFLEKGCIFSHIDEMNISTINDTQYMTYEYFIHQPMQSIQRRTISNLKSQSHSRIISFIHDINY